MSVEEVERRFMLMQNRPQPNAHVFELEYIETKVPTVEQEVDIPPTEDLTNVKVRYMVVKIINCEMCMYHGILYRPVDNASSLWRGGGGGGTLYLKLYALPSILNISSKVEKLDQPHFMKISL